MKEADNLHRRKYSFEELQADLEERKKLCLALIADSGLRADVIEAYRKVINLDLQINVHTSKITIERHAKKLKEDLYKLFNRLRSTERIDEFDFDTSQSLTSNISSDISSWENELLKKWYRRKSLDN